MWLAIVCVVVIVACLVALVRDARKERFELYGHCVRPTTSEERRARFGTVHRYPEDLSESYHAEATGFKPPTLSGKASKGIKRDGVIGIDQVTPAERRRALKLLGLPPLE